MTKAPDKSVVFDINAIQLIVRNGIPHCNELGVEVTAFEGNHCTLALPWQERLVGDPATGTLHGGVVTTLIDSACGMAVYAAMRKTLAIATLDIRIDYLKPAPARLKLFARCECYKVTRHIAFVEGYAYVEGAPDDHVAKCTATFMISSSDSKPMVNLDPRKKAAT